MLDVRNLDKSFGAIHVTRDVSLTLERGERRVILGPNGAGKTTLFNQLVGEIAPDRGTVALDGQEITPLNVSARASAGLSRSYQKNTLCDGLTCRDNLALAAATHTGAIRSFFRDPLTDRAVQDIVAETAELVHLTPYLDRRVSEISYGIRRQ